MNAFRFRLEPLLRLRRAALDEQRSKLAEAYRADVILEQHLRGIEEQIAANQRDRRQAAGAGMVDIDAALQTQRFDIALQAQHRELARRREELAAVIERQRDVVIEADRELKMLERLRERRLAEHRAAQELQEVKRLDEVAALARREEP
jgi:flagellar protein FliJ